MVLLDKALLVFFLKSLVSCVYSSGAYCGHESTVLRTSKAFCRHLNTFAAMVNTPRIWHEPPPIPEKAIQYIDDNVMKGRWEAF